MVNPFLPVMEILRKKKTGKGAKEERMSEAIGAGKEEVSQIPNW